MSNELISEEELTKKRTPPELWSWVRQKTDQIYYSSDEARRALTLHNRGLEKKLMEEVLPLAIFGKHKFGDTDQVLLQPVIDDPHYDAVVTDRTTDPSTESFIEITLSHEGRDNYLRRCQLLEKGYVPPYAPVIKTRTKRGWAFSIPAEATSVVERVENERQRILAAAKRKEGKKYLPSTSLVIFFDDARSFQEEMDNVRLDSFVTSNILNLDLRFSTLYLVGWGVFREYSLVKKI
jgi:hypothetical protein